MKRPIYLIIFIFVTIISLAVAQVSVANQLSTTGAELAALQTQVDNYKRENTILQEETLAASSFTTIAEKAESEGFSDVKTQLSIIKTF